MKTILKESQRRRRISNIHLIEHLIQVNKHNAMQRKINLQKSYKVINLISKKPISKTANIILTIDKQTILSIPLTEIGSKNNRRK